MLVARTPRQPVRGLQIWAKAAALSLVLALLIAGCATIAAAGFDASTASITKAQAVAYARAINLRLGDVRGMTITGPAEREGSRGQHSSGELERCVGSASPGQQLIDIGSPTFGRGGALEQSQVSSGVTVLSSAAVAAREFAAIRSARGRACIARFARREFSHESSGLLHYRAIARAKLTAPVAGIGESFGLRFTVTFLATRTGHRFHLYLDFLGFLEGPAEISLNTSGFTRPVSAATERRLFSTLYRRAQAHKL
jgi:hypothetical protein